MKNSIRIKSNRILMVEGNHDKQFFEELSAYMDFGKDDIQIIITEGKGNFGPMIKLLSNPISPKKITRIGFVRDTDEHPAHSVFQSICSHLEKNRFPVPKTMSEVTEGDPQCGIFIMPNNESGGMLESLCLESIQNQVISEAIDQYMSAVEKNNAAMYGKLNQPKSRILT